MFWVHIWWWLQDNNLVKAVVAWSVGLVLNSVWAVRVWMQKQKRDKEAHAALMDRLDTTTPGGLGEIKRLMRDDEQDPDDNGSDLNSDEKRKATTTGHSAAMWPDIMHGVKGGGSGAGHH